MHTYIILCEITKEDCNILLHCQSATSLALVWAQSPLPLPLQTKQTENHTIFEGVYHEVWGRGDAFRWNREHLPNQFHCEVKRAGGFHEYICVFIGWGGYEDKDESKSVQNRQQLNEFL